MQNLHHIYSHKILIYMHHHVCWMSLLLQGEWKNRSVSDSLKYPFLLLSERKAKWKKSKILPFVLTFSTFYHKAECCFSSSFSRPKSCGKNQKSGETVFASPMDTEIHSCRTLGFSNGNCAVLIVWYGPGQLCNLWLIPPFSPDICCLLVPKY